MAIREYAIVKKKPWGVRPGLLGCLKRDRTWGVDVEGERQYRLKCQQQNDVKIIHKSTQSNTPSHLFDWPQYYRARFPAPSKNRAVKNMSIIPTFSGRDKQRIGQQIGTGVGRQGQGRLNDLLITGMMARADKWIGRVVQQPTKCELWEIDNAIRAK